MVLYVDSSTETMGGSNCTHTNGSYLMPSFPTRTTKTMREGERKNIKGHETPCSAVPGPSRAKDTTKVLRLPPIISCARRPPDSTSAYTTTAGPNQIPYSLREINYRRQQETEARAGEDTRGRPALHAEVGGLHEPYLVPPSRTRHSAFPSQGVPRQHAQQQNTRNKSLPVLLPAAGTRHHGISHVS